MRSPILAISCNTFREAVRDRVLYNLIVFALLLVASAPLFEAISINIERLVLVNLGLSAISFFGVIIAIFIGIGLVSKEIEKKTLYTILSRPVRRWEFIVGKYLGLVSTLAVNAVCMTLGFYLALFAFARPLQSADAWILVAIYFILLQFLMITAITLLFSSFTTPVFSAVFAFALFVIGTFAGDLAQLSLKAHGVSRVVLMTLTYLLPDFSSLNVIGQVAHQKPVPAGLIGLNTGYAVLYSAAVTAAAALIFSRRNLK